MLVRGFPINTFDKSAFTFSTQMIKLWVRHNTHILQYTYIFITRYLIICHSKTGSSNIYFCRDTKKIYI